MHDTTVLRLKNSLKVERHPVHDVAKRSADATEPYFSRCGIKSKRKQNLHVERRGKYGIRLR